MILVPSKNLSRGFLKSLAENRFISPGGKEYFEEQTLELLREKEVKAAHLDYTRELKERAKQIDHVSTITAFQDSMLKRLKLGDHKNLSDNSCQDVTPCELVSVSTTNQLKEIKPGVLIAPASMPLAPVGSAILHSGAPSVSGGKMKRPKKMFGHIVNGPETTYAYKQIRRDIANTTKVIERLKSLSQAK